MRVSAFLALVSMGTMAASCDEGAAPAVPTAAPVVEDVQLRPCPDPDPMQGCRFDHVKAPEYLAQALAGDYQAQRNIAALQGSGSPWIVKRPIQACGWRMVAVASRPADSTYDEEAMYKVQCGSLSTGDLSDAKVLANSIYRRIHGSDLPELPAPH